MSCLPEHLEGRRYYQPTDRGLEAKIKEALEKARTLRTPVQGQRHKAEGRSDE
jgi:replication-associated recombination protein RarA